MKVIRSLVNWLLHHPVWGGIAIEAFLVGLFVVFPAGPCNAPVVGVAVMLLHSPAALLIEMFHIHMSGQYQAMLIAGLMVPIWVGILAAIQHVRLLRKR